MSIKILILGDIHGRKCWRDIICVENPDLTIFLGDYVSTHEGIESSVQITNLEDILIYKESNPDKVILLRGNHDMQHLGYPWAECSGYSPHVAEYMIKNRDRFLNLTQWIEVRNGVIYSHAGVSDIWMKNSNISNIYNVNKMEPSEVFGFTPCKLSDYTGISKTQPCTWIRPQTLAECMYGQFDQVVGHSPIRSITNIKSIYPECKNNLWCCDNLPSQYILNIDGEFIVKDYEKTN